MSKYFLTTPIYYVNARPHIGHAYTTIVADVLARRHRLLGDDTFFLTGTDEHGQKIERSAQAAGIEPQTFADQVSAQFRSLWDRMGLTYDRYIRTTDPAHKRGVQKLFATLYERGFIYLASYTGSYCVSDEAFVDLPAGTPCPDCGRPLETVTEENFFFKLSGFQQPLLDLIESNQLLITPDTARNEVLSFIRGGLKDLSISRSSFTWGVPVPEPAASAAAQKHVIYVWLDALANYMTALGYGADTPEGEADWQRFWPADLHLVGKEITRFHCVYWPAFLMAAGIPTPAAITANGWLLFDNSKMSKSRGNVVRTETILDAFGPLCPPLPREASLEPPPPFRSQASVRSQASGQSPLSHRSNSSAHPPVSFQSEPSTQPPSPYSNEAHAPSAPQEPLGTPRLQPWPSNDASKEGLQPLGQTPSSHDQNLSAPNIPRDSHNESQSPSAPQEPLGTPRLQPWPSNDAPKEGLQPLGQTPSSHDQDLFASDVLRYYLLREIPFGQDGSFSFDAMITRYNADLANGYGNLVSRTLGLISQNYSGIEGGGSGSIARVPPLSLGNDEAAKTYSDGLHGIATSVIDFLASSQDVDFFSQLQKVFGFIQAVDVFINEEKPWKLASEAKASLLKVHPEADIAAKFEAERKRDAIKLECILYTAAESIRIITALLYPILPYATASVWRQLGLGDIEQSAQNGELKNLQWGGLKPGTRLGPLAPIFPRADKGLAQIMSDMESPAPPLAAVTAQHDTLNPASDDLPIASLASEPPTHDPGAGPRTASLPEANPGSHVAGSAARITERTGTPSHTEAASGIFAHQPGDSSPQITIDDFAKVELRVAQILVCERIPKADKLLRLEVDLGYETRQILSGIAEWYTPEDLIGRRIVVITNLAPRKMRGLESHGMLLAASTEGGKPHLATFADADSLPLGSRLK